MNWQVLLPSIISFISGFGLAITKGLSKIIEDTWTDYRNEKKRIKQRKSQIVSQLLFDIPRGKSNTFDVIIIKKSEGEQTIAKISSYNKKMAKKIESYLNLWRHFASSNIEYKNTGMVLIPDENGDMDNKGLDYLDQLLSKLYNEYDEIIDLLNKWNR